MHTAIMTVLIVIGATIGVIALPFLLYKLFKWTGRLIGHVFTFVGGMLGDALRLVGTLLTSIVFFPLVILNIAIGRWSASKHYWRAFQNEVVSCGHCVYRLAIGHPARLLMLTPLTEGLERRIPEAIAQAPTSDRPSKRTGSFDGYTIVGSLKGGGSGGKLYIAEPDPRKRAAFERRGQVGVDRVVLKSFSLADGSSLPQIIRESRALEAARELGLVLDHELTPQRFFYAMAYVPGDSLSVVTERLHTRSGPEGLGQDTLSLGMGYIADLLMTLERYHASGLWHKDIKPDNIIVGQDGRAHLVDLGLVTPLRSAMTLTTHGTEYFRDPELVRLAMRGVKVHEVPGVKFDVYGAGACLFALIERSFPAHGGLSRITKRCPETLRWIVRRSMADLHQRYASAGEMLADLEAVRNAPDPFELKPADLPSMREGGEPVQAIEEPVLEAVAFTPPARTPMPPAPQPRPAAREEERPRRVRLTDWWTGRYEMVEEGGAPDAPPAASVGAPAMHARVLPAERRRAAADQLRAARERVASARARVRARRTGRHRARYSHTSPAHQKSSRAFWPLIVLVFCGLVGASLLVPALAFRQTAPNARSTQGPFGAVEATPAQSPGEARITLLNTFPDGVTELRTVSPEGLAVETVVDDAHAFSYLVFDPMRVLDRADSDASLFVQGLEQAGAKLDRRPDVETEARLLATVGDALPGNSFTTAMLQEWLSAETTPYEALIWFGSSEPGAGDAPAWQLIYRTDRAMGRVIEPSGSGRDPVISPPSAGQVR